MKKAIDISKHNGKVNWSAISKQGLSAVILRAGYGKSTVDEQFINNVKGANSIDLPVGIYWFSYALNVEMAKNEADFCYKTIKDYKIDLPVFFDFEYDSDDYYKKQSGKTCTNKLRTEMCVAFCERIKEHGMKAGIYYNKDYMNNKLDMTKLKDYTQWMAYYSDKQPSNVAMWQYSETGKIDGISGSSVDMNYILDDNILPVSSEAFPSKKEIVRNLQTALNSDYNCKLVVDGAYGKLSQKAVTTHNIKKGSKTHVVKWLQRRLNELGYKGKDGKALSIDGDFGSNTLYACKQLQKKFKLSQDGVIGCATMIKLLSCYK